MRFSDNFTIEYDSDMPEYGGNITVRRGDSEPIMFRHFRMDVDGTDADRTSTRFNDTQGVELSRPHIISPSAQAACGEATKIAVDRMIAELVADGNDPFVREA